MMFKLIKNNLFSILLFTLISFQGQSQPANPGGGGKPLPITGIEILIGAGAAFGIKKIISRVKSKKEE